MGRDPMLACPRCGRENPEGSQFCNACAEPLTPEVVASGEAMRSALRRDRAEESAEESAAEASRELEDEPKGGHTYVRWSSWPWGALRTTEQSFDQFLITSIIAFFGIFVLFLGFASGGQPLLGGLVALAAVGAWLFWWQAGRWY